MKNQVSLHALIDSGSMVYIMNKETEQKLQSVDLNTECIVKCENECTVYGQEVSVPTLVMPGQCDQLTLVLNVRKHLIHLLKQNSRYWHVMGKPKSNQQMTRELNIF